MRLCKKCSGLSPENSKFCQNCGTPFEDESPLGMGNTGTSDKNSGQYGAAAAYGAKMASGNGEINSVPHASQNSGNTPEGFGQRTASYDSPQMQQGAPVAPPSPSTVPTPGYGGKAPKPGHTGKQMLISAVTIVIVTVISIIGGSILSSVMENSKYREFDEAIEKKENYVPGTFDGKTYSSEHLGMRMNFGKGWENASEEDYAIVTEEVTENIESNLAQNVKVSGVNDKKALEKLEESLYSSTELVAYLEDDGGYVAELYLYAFGCYGFDDVDIDELSELKSELNLQSARVEDITIAGNKAVKATITDDFDVYKNAYYFMHDGNFVLIITAYLEDYRDIVCDVVENAEKI